MPLGLLKKAVVPVPSAKAAALPPASVVTMPRGVTSRMRLLPVSATNTASLAESMAMPCGPEKPAAMP